MRLRRALLSLAAIVPLGVIVPPAAADPIPGGCVGLPSEPAAYLCVYDIDPDAAPPAPGSSGTLTTIPEICYFLGCTGPTDVPAPTLEGSGTYAIVYYNGQSYEVRVPPVSGIGNPASSVFLQGALAVQRVADLLCEAGGGNVTIGDWVPEKEVYWYRCENGDATTTQLSNGLYGVALTLYLLSDDR